MKENSMESKTISLRDRCHINNGGENDSFVGVKYDGTNIFVCFPLGYCLPDCDEEIRKDIWNLLYVLSLFDSNKNDFFSNSIQKEFQNCFPLQSYLDIIQYFFSNGYYMEKEVKYKIGSNGKINWCRTIKTQIPYWQNNHFVYSRYVTKMNTSSNNGLITKINKYCVYESFEKLFWLFGDFIPECPTYKIEKNKWLSFLNLKLCQTNDEKLKRLFYAMSMIINFSKNEPNSEGLFFGTNHFEYIWQWMIDKAFGIGEKDDYLPHSFWLAKFGKEKSKKKSPLLPDTIMLLENEFFILDSKYYRYGKSSNMDDLPNSSDIYKQIAYGGFIENNKAVDSSYIFNAFIIPFNSKENDFIYCNDWCLNVAEAIPEKTNGNYKNYERIQAILIDTRWIFLHFRHISNYNRIKLANTIKER